MDNYINNRMLEAEKIDEERKRWHAHIRKRIYAFLGKKRFLAWTIIEVLLITFTLIQVGLLLTSNLTFTYQNEVIELNVLKFVIVPLSLLGIIMPLGLTFLFLSSRTQNDDLTVKGLGLIGVHYKIIILAFILIGIIFFFVSILISFTLFLIFLIYAVITYVIYRYLNRALKLLDDLNNYITLDPSQKIKPSIDPLSIRGFAIFIMVIQIISFLINLGSGTEEDELLNQLPNFPTIQAISLIQSVLVVISISMIVYLLGVLHKTLYEDFAYENE